MGRVRPVSKGLDHPRRENENGQATPRPPLQTGPRTPYGATRDERQIQAPLPQRSFGRSSNFRQHHQRRFAPARVRQDADDRPRLPRHGQQPPKREQEVAPRCDRAPTRTCREQRRSPRLSPRRALGRARADDAILVRPS